MKHLNSILEIVLRFLLEIPLELLSYVVVPIACLFVKDNKLPKIVSWFDDYDYGPNGDSGWQGPDHANGQQEKYLWRVRFLLRNRINTFSKVVQGVSSKDILSIIYQGNVKVENAEGKTEYIKPEEAARRNKGNPVPRRTGPTTKRERAPGGARGRGRGR